MRVAEELIARERVNVLMGTFASNVGLAVANLANQRKILFVASEPLTDKIVWENGNRYTLRLRPSTYMQTAMLVPEAAKLKKQRWAIVYPNYEYGQSATASFKKLLSQAQPGVQFVAEQAPALGKIEAGAVVQALAEANPTRSSARSSPPTCRSSCAKEIPGAFSRTRSCSTCSAASRSTSIRSRTRRRKAGGSRAIPGARSIRRSTRRSATHTRSAGRTIRGSARWSAIPPSRRGQCHPQGEVG